LTTLGLRSTGCRETPRYEQSSTCECTRKGG
jgi:hypothetical protein